MNHGRELLFKVLSHQPSSNVPWVPFAGVHAGKLRGYSAHQVLQDEEKLFESLLTVHQTYHPDGMPIVFDLQVEAEILGCQLLWAEKTPPSVVSHPLQKSMDIPTHLPEKTDGRLPMITTVMDRMKKAVGDETALYGLVTGPLTLASHLRGTEVFMDLYDHPDFLHALLDFCTHVAMRISEYYLQAGMDVIAIVDPVVSQISPKHFREFLGQLFKGVFNELHGRNAFSSFFVCGDATKNLEVMCQTGPDSLAVDENINMNTAKQITDKYNITLQGNIPLTSLMLLGNQQDNMKYVVDLLDSLSSGSEQIPSNLIISPGCDMPYDIPPENVVGISQAIREPQRIKLVLADYQSQKLDLESVKLPDYEQLSKPLIEVFTLNSDTCPACGYMLLAAQRAAQELAGKVEMIEYKATTPENIARMRRLGVKNLPAILINGELNFSSLIPNHRELLDAIHKYLK